MRSLPICNTHLPEFYEAIKANDLTLMEKIEHELTSEEKCVACTYVLKSRGTAREALKAFLSGEPMDIGKVEAKSNKVLDEFLYWGARLMTLSIILMLVFSMAIFISRYIFSYSFSFGVFQITSVVVVSLALFLYIDDRFLD